VNAFAIHCQLPLVPPPIEFAYAGVVCGGGSLTTSISFVFG
jgi:hypothetical protein